MSDNPKTATGIWVSVVAAIVMQTLGMIVLIVLTLGGRGSEKNISDTATIADMDARLRQVETATKDLPEIMTTLSNLVSLMGRMETDFGYYRDFMSEPRYTRDDAESEFKTVNRRFDRMQERLETVDDSILRLSQRITLIEAKASAEGSP